MKTSYLLGIGIIALESVGALHASQPTDINYCAKGKTALGVAYSTYTVRCSDGKKREITAWNNRKKWCVGTSSNCTEDQLKTAQQACSKSK
jgi:hypothetical protein